MSMATASMADRIRSLSPRQVEAVAWTWHGYTTAEIARAMGCSYDTAHRHLATAYLRLGVCGEGRDSTRVRAAVALFLALRQATKGAGCDS